MSLRVFVQYNMRPKSYFSACSGEVSKRKAPGCPFEVVDSSRYYTASVFGIGWTRGTTVCLSSERKAVQLITHGNRYENSCTERISGVGPVALFRIIRRTIRSPEAMSTSAGGNTQSFPPVDDADSEIGMFLRDLRCLLNIA